MRTITNLAATSTVAGPSAIGPVAFGLWEIARRLIVEVRGAVAVVGAIVLRGRNEAPSRASPSRTQVPRCTAFSRPASTMPFSNRAMLA